MRAHTSFAFLVDTTPFCVAPTASPTDTMDQVIQQVADRAPIFASVGLLLVTAFLFSVLRSSKGGVDKIPLVGQELGGVEQRRKAYLSNAKDLYQQGYQRFKNSVFRLTDTDGT